MTKLKMYALTVAAPETSVACETKPFGKFSFLLFTLSGMAAGKLLKQFIFVIGVLLMASSSLNAQAWSNFLDSSRAVDWTGVGFTIPNYTANCAVQPTLTPNNSGAASANTTAIQNALNSCDATHNVVSIPAGTYYANGWTYGSQGKQVVRGAGPNSTNVVLNGAVSCTGLWSGICMVARDWTYAGNGDVQPPTGGRQCGWTTGYAKGSTTITLSSCGGMPPVNKMLILDQADDTSDTNGVYICDSSTTNCTYEGAGSFEGRTIGSEHHTMQQVVAITGVTSLGGNSYSVTISPGVAFSNVRSAKNPGAWWPGFVQNEGLENLTVDGSAASSTLTMFSCYQCWAKNVKFLNGGRNSVWFYQSANSVIRDSYFYKAQSSYSTSYTIESTSSSRFLVENNIFQQVTTPFTLNTATGSVFGYNFSIDSIFSDGSYAWGGFATHNAGNNMNLFEGNNIVNYQADNAWGGSAQSTWFRNMIRGVDPYTASSSSPKAKVTNTTSAIIFRSYNRAFNIVGNVMGNPTWHTNYESYATSSSGGVNGGYAGETHSIYSLGWSYSNGSCNTPCDSLTRSTLMRWGNYDTVNQGARWDSTEASPGPVSFLNANFTSSYFSSLARTLPASLYHTSKPSWWPTTKAWPPIGPDVANGNVGICTGTYSGFQGTSGSQCSGGTLNSAYAAHATSIPAQDCYLNVMHGPPDGTGSALKFDANACYSATDSGPAAPTGLTTTIQ